MNRAQFLSLLVVALLCFSGLAPAQESAAPAVPPKTPASNQIVVPADTTIPLALRNTISSRTASVGQAIYCETVFPITVGNRIVIPVGSYVKGAVAQVLRPGRVKGRAQIGLRFESIILPNGTTKPFRATLSGYGGTGEEGFNKVESKVEGQSTKGQDAGKVARTTVTGAQIGTIVGLGKGAPGKGLGVGSAIGAAGGLIWVLASRGKEIVLPAGTSLELQLGAPLSFERDELVLDLPGHYEEGPALPRREPGPSL